MTMATEMELHPACDSRRALALRLLPLLDLTSLGEDDTPEAIESLCASARSGYVVPAALCVYPEHVTTARRALRGSGVRIATVVNFPDGAADRERVLRETRRSLAAGAEEIDLVLPRKLDTPADRLAAQSLVAACREICGSEIILKLILETGLLQTPQRIRAACVIGLAESVDFLKTSTGKVAVNATLEASAIMLEAIAEHGGRCGIKVAGGIRTLEQGESYLAQANARFGSSWVTATHFRIGASSLFGELVAAISPAS
ncbi:MAG TPA: deoxyribose-phosphate aldolase [Dokdonella sp.]|uniref:deoxyribose-phosphate aldolase n=1 Tax=Dokdonella sp. TaxID=2291710 RepID=UPI002D7F6985|nr:deoxyribose-phosphate aldolase [Dokdonella sp.]HET9031442.1 deoxyribose-phosphate aldolase [Dokdonella sp.]